MLTLSFGGVEVSRFVFCGVEILEKKRPWKNKSEAEGTRSNSGTLAQVHAALSRTTAAKVFARSSIYWNHCCCAVLFFFLE